MSSSDQIGETDESAGGVGRLAVTAVYLLDAANSTYVEFNER
jgi:hypothetical protein